MPSFASLPKRLQPMSLVDFSLWKKTHPRTTDHSTSLIPNWSCQDLIRTFFFTNARDLPLLLRRENFLLGPSAELQEWWGRQPRKLTSWCEWALCIVCRGCSYHVFPYESSLPACNTREITHTRRTPKPQRHNQCLPRFHNSGYLVPFPAPSRPQKRDWKYV